MSISNSIIYIYIIWKFKENYIRYFYHTIYLSKAASFFLLSFHINRL